MKWILWLIVCVFSLQALSEKIQVCSITLNSVDEINIFQQHLPKTHFEFIELVPRSHQVSNYDKGRWLSNVCENQNLHCDILVVSAHFAGMFFGENSRYTLPIYELEKMACQKSCPRIFDNLKEVFLFGCNTMAHKRKVYRTAEEYFNVLVEENNMPVNIAEINVAGRYSSLDPSFKDRIEHIFPSTAKIYGFTEISPYGHQAIKPLNQYFSRMISEHGSYHQYLIAQFYQNNNTHRLNRHFIDAFTPISSVQQGAGMTPSYSRYNTFQQMCTLYSETSDTKKQMQAVYDLFQNNEGVFAFSAVKQFLVNKQDQLDADDLQLLEEIQAMAKEKQAFERAYASLSPKLIYIRAAVLQFLRLMNWMDKDTYQQELRNTLLPSIKKPSLGSYDILDALTRHDQLNPFDIPVHYNDFGLGYLKNIWSILIVDSLRFAHPSMQTDLANYCIKEMEKENYVICHQVLKTLGHIQASNPQVLDMMHQMLSADEYGLVYYATYGLTYAETDNPQIQFQIVQNLKHTNAWIRLQSLLSVKYLDLIEIAPQEVTKRVQRLLHTEIQRTQVPENEQEAHKQIKQQAREILMTIEDLENMELEQP